MTSLERTMGWFLGFRGSVGEFAESIRYAAKEGVLRDPLVDAQAFLELAQMQTVIEYKQDVYPNKATILVANHFARTRWQSKSSISTIESIRTTALIEDAWGEVNYRKTSWVINTKIHEGWLTRFASYARDVQEALVKVHGHVPLSATVIRRIETRLRDGENIGIYPEGKVSSSMKMCKPGFEDFIGYVKRRRQDGLEFQFVPVGVYVEAGVWHVKFGEAVEEVEGSLELMHKVARLLPERFRGDYD